MRSLLQYSVIIMSNMLLWMKPFGRQCFAILGVSLGMASTSQVMAFTSVMLPQLRLIKNIDDEQASWIVSINGISLFFGLLMTPFLMSRYGRRTVNLVRSAILAVTWGVLLTTTDIHMILFIRFIQGFCLGFASIVIPVLIGEYSSPKYRGAFLTTMALGISLGVLSLHVIGSFFSWKTASAFCCGIALLNIIIILFSPESPSYYVARGRYDECRIAFNWLRYPEEKKELEKMIAKHMSESQGKVPTSLLVTLRNKITGFFEMWKKKEFYKPIIIILHLHIINEWSSANVFDAYTSDIFYRLMGQDIDISLMLLSIDILRAVSSVCTVIFIRKFQRRLMLAITISLNILSYIVIIVYSYAKSHELLAFDHPLIGKTLIHIHVLTFSVGNLVMPNILAGEIFATEYRGISNMFGQIFFCVNYMVCTKTALAMLSSLGLHGMYMVYAAIVSYGLIVTWLMVPETKDKTLQEIEEEFRRRTEMQTNIEAMNKLLPRQS